MSDEKPKAKPVTLAELVKGAQAQIGERVITEGVELIEAPRYATGIFPVDFAIGGGFPGGRVSVVYGPHASGKTTLALKAIARAQQQHPDKRAVFVDVEGAYDEAHGLGCGVDNSKLIYALPDSAEQAVDIVDQLIYAEDLSILVVDSLAALATTAELDASAMRASVGGATLPVGKLYRKVTVAMNAQRRDGFQPAFIAINQVREKIGVMFGDTRTQPGGKAFGFAASLILYTTGKKIGDKKIHPDVPAWLHSAVRVEKNKVPILAATAEYDIAIVQSKAFPMGYVKDWTMVLARLKKAKLLQRATGKGGGWQCCGRKFKTQQALRSAMRNDPEYYAKVCAAIVDHFQNDLGVGE